MLAIEQIDGGDIAGRQEIDLEVAHEPSRRHPEIVSDQAEGLKVLAVALPQGRDKFRPLGRRVSEQPLLELVQNDQRLGPLRGKHLPIRRADIASTRQELSDSRREGLLEAPKQTGFGLFSNRFNIDCTNTVAEHRQEPGLDK